ncbi:unnamed protein product [Arabidopsis lyrata]|uniref:RNase H type-1 domain-containing protein n=1 Tax=Arabidopsis lyrata subsp. lyrata TaxID=81972 RepID=D7M9A7_ARALL|nr:hypothetical protein ARALYDRAFT_913120 [Arabidopsis lyrata subsp. lyrata]CAH8274521.1 unnamed protein product [Arabidopsis lyrata]
MAKARLEIALSVTMMQLYLNNDVPIKAGWIIRDNKGSYLGSRQSFGKVSFSALESEFHALILASTKLLDTKIK